MDNSSRLVLSSFIRTFSFFINIIVTIVLMPFIIHSLGKEVYGLWAIANSFLAFFNLFDLGLSSAIQRFISRALGKKEFSEANVVIVTSLIIFIVIGIVVFLLAVPSAFLIQNLVKGLEGHTIILRNMVIILGWSAAIGFPSQVFSGILAAHLRHYLVSSISLAMVIIRSILIVIFLKSGYGIIALTVITVSVNIAAYFILFISAKFVAKYMDLSLKYFSKVKMKMLFNFSVFVIISSVADRLRFNIDNFVIARFVNLQAVTVYAIAANLIQQFITLLISGLGILMPVFSQYEAQGDADSIKKTFVFATKLSSYASIGIGAMILIFKEPFIQRWMGEGYAGSILPLTILVIGVTGALMQYPSLQLLMGISKHKFISITNSLEGIGNLVLSLILVRMYGIVGVALGTTIPMLFVKFTLQPFYTCKSINLSLLEYYLKIIFPILLKTIPFYFGVWYVVKGITQPKYVSIFLYSVLTLILYALLVYLIGFNKEEKVSIRGLLLKVKSKVALRKK